MVSEEEQKFQDALNKCKNRKERRAFLQKEKRMNHLKITHPKYYAHLKAQEEAQAGK